MRAKLSKSKIKGKKYTVEIGGRRVDFGAAGYQDYTQHHDPERRRAYLMRHKKKEDWRDPLTAGFWSRWLLWDKPSILDAKRNITRMFGIRFV